MLVALGLSNTGAVNDVEIIDLKDPNLYCQNLPAFPKQTYGAIGGLGLQNEPFICGGNSPSNDFNQECYSYQPNSWSESFRLNDKRSFASAAVSTTPNELVKIIVTGGKSDLATLNSFEALSTHGWTTYWPRLPTTMMAHCSVLIKSTTLMLIGGSTGVTPWSDKTYVLRTNNFTWNDGPPLSVGRYGLSCSRIKRDSQGTSYSSIAIGGSNGNVLAVVEILDDGATAWRNGPFLPYGIFYGSIVQDSDGGVVLAGGASEDNTYLSTIFRLANGGDNWILLTQQLKTSRYLATGFLLPDHFTNCSLLSNYTTSSVSTIVNTTSSITGSLVASTQIASSSLVVSSTTGTQK